MMNPVVFLPTENLTIDTVTSDLKRLLAVLDAHPKVPFVFDLNQVLQCDTAGLALLIEAKRLCALKKSSFRIENMPHTMRDLARFCDVEHLFLGEFGG
ncbi:MAG: STAS domain-containing protein [Legionellaceae bacterium]|nr:STAS domain-containing protein [Legionellaceae bacterium]